VATFVIGATTATFHATIVSSEDSAGDLERLNLSIHVDNDTAWLTLFSLVTTKYHVHVPLGGSNVIVDIVRGPGAGTLAIDGLGSTSGILTTLSRPTYLPNGRSLGSATFLITGPAL